MGKMMKNASLKRIMALTLVSFLLVLIPVCYLETEQDRVRKVIATIQKAAEEKDIRKVVNSLSKTYSDPQGFTYDTIKGLLLGYFFRHQNIHVYITNLDVTVDDSVGRAVFQAVLSGGNKTGSATDILPEALGMYAFDASFKKEDGEWKVSSAKWNRVAENSP
jgi:hypothetical protein